MLFKNRAVNSNKISNCEIERLSSQVVKLDAENNLKLAESERLLDRLNRALVELNAIEDQAKEFYKIHDIELLKKRNEDKNSSNKNLEAEINRLSEERDKAKNELASIQANAEQFFKINDFESLKKELENAKIM